MKTKISLGLALFCSAKLLAQDIEYINPTTDWLRLNPAYAGSNGGFRAQLNDNVSAPSSVSRSAQAGISSDWYVKKIKSGISLSLNSLSIGNGNLRESTFSLGYAKQLQIKNYVVTPAIQITALQKSVDVNALNFTDKIDPRWNEQFQNPLVFPASSKKALDFNAGAIVDLKNGFVFGFAARHITQPDIGVVGFLKLPTKYVLHASYDKVVSESKSFNVFVSLSEQNGTEEARLQASAVVMKHLYFGVGAGISNNYNFGLGHLGYKGNFWNVAFLFGSRYYAESKSFSNSTQVALAATIRDKEQRRNLTALHAW